MVHEKESWRDSHRPKDSGRDGSKGRKSRDIKDEKYEREEKYSRHGEDYHSERKAEKLNDGKIRSSAKEAYNYEEEYQQREVSEERQRSRKEDRHKDERVRDNAYDRDRHRHRDKVGKHEDDSFDKLEDENSGKHLDGSKDKFKGRIGEKIRDMNGDKDSNREADRHRSGHKETRKEPVGGDVEEKYERKDGDRDTNKETDRHNSGHKDMRKEPAIDDMQEKYDRKERVQKRKDRDDTNKTVSELRDRQSKRRKEPADLEKPIKDEKDRGGKRKRVSDDVGLNSSAVTTPEADAKIKLQSSDQGRPISSTKLDSNGVSSVSDEPSIPTAGFQHLSFPVTEVAASITGPLPPVPSKTPTSTPASVEIIVQKSERFTQDGIDDSSKSVGAAGSSEDVKTSSLSLDALMKAKKALQMQKELSEKLKKLPQLSKAVTHTSVALTPSAPPLAASSAATTSILSAPVSVNASATVTGGIGFVSGMMPGMPGVLPNLGTISNYEAVKRAQEYVVRLGFQQPPGSIPLLGVVPPHGSFEAGTPIQPKTVKAPVLRLDAHGREIDEHGNIMDRPKVANVSTLKVNINKQKKEAFQILHPELDEDPIANPFFDPRMGTDRKKLVRPKRSSFQFVEEGKWSKEAEILRLNSQFGEAKAKEIKTKQAALAKAKAEADINPNLIEVVERIPIKEKPAKDPIPDVEWWDAVLLPSGSYKDVTEGELKVKIEKLTIYVEHPVPIEPPAEPSPPPPQPLKLTKKEQKKLRTQRRLAKEKDRQEMIRQGLIEPPKSKVKMSNLMKVLGAEATQDPTRLEQEIRTAAAEREQAHTDRNLARKLTPAERREKKEKKLFDDSNTLETIVSVYRVNDLSHAQLRFKVDINAQENRLTGCVVMCDALSVVIVEGGSKSIKRYSKLMLKRINWAAIVKEEDQGEEDKPHRVNKCSLVWQGSVAKPAFGKFLIQQCRTEVAARKFLADAGVAHYWDLAANFSDE
ncbi:hypothetical protein O6H91_01G074600 [Diphasiastrum complanatum]|uniref:Uncharacterized protein n=1 Tax=Diphasiastrum complanatum TaxID=34168 RepID=A0ACC2ES51_DIPCM|nr:hypothetical protein O6H91_01G074600 [Diphasiastrum complanatum]